MLRLAASRGGGPETRSGTVQTASSRNEPRGSKVLHLAASRGGAPKRARVSRAARLPSAAPGSIKGGGPRNALGYRPEPEVSRNEPRGCRVLRLAGRPEPEVLPLPAETSREAAECCAWQGAALGSIQGGGPETRSGTVQSLKCCPYQQKRAARLPSAAPGSIEGGGPETRSGTVQSLKCLKCCPCQQKRAARLPSAAPGSIEGGGPETRSGTVQRMKCCPCQQKRAARNVCASV